MLRAVTPPVSEDFRDGLAECLSTVQAYAFKEVTRLEALVSDLRAENKHLAERLEIASSGRGSPFNLQAGAQAEDTYTEAAKGHTCMEALPVVPQIGGANPVNYVEASEAEETNQLSGFDKSVKSFRRSQTSQNSEAIKAEVKALNKKNARAAATLYHDDGWAQQIVKSHWFEKASLGVILLNSLWISIDLDLNMADSTLTADHVFVFMDNFFCLFFTLELAVRFAALKRKSDCLLDPWFAFDSVLVLAMILETWIVTLVMLITGTSSIPGLGSMSVLRMLRLLRLTRMARMMHAFPEVMILVTGLQSSIRSVMVTIVMLVAITYIFAIILKLLTLDSTLGDEFYKSVPDGMATLFFETVVPDNAGMLEELFNEAWYLAVIFSIFIGLSALTFMNMIIGFLCEVVSTVSAEEREAAEIERMTEKLQDIIAALDTNYDGIVSPAEVASLLSNKAALESLQRVGVDVMALVQEMDFFVDDEGLLFDDFVELVLQFRATQAATIGVIAGLRKSVHHSMRQIEESVRDLEHKISSRSDAHFSL